MSNGTVARPCDHQKAIATLCTCVQRHGDECADRGYEAAANGNSCIVLSHKYYHIYYSITEVLVHRH